MITSPIAMSETNWWQVTWDSDFRRPRHLPSPRQRRTLRRRGAPKKTPGADSGKLCKVQGFMKIMPKILVKLLNSSIDCAHFSACACRLGGNRRGTQREVQFHQQNQWNACQVDDDRGHFLFGHVCRETRIDLRIQSSTFT